ncbi:MAG TPA: DUF2147 domain-containing protein [Chitinophagaceae bacterium]|nr:DUF2147 domain-containing protein [Chitinophagaceae bacterium]
MKERTVSFIAIASLLSFKSFSQIKADDILGVWMTGGKEPAKIQIYKSGEKYYGKIIWLKNPIENGKQRADANNPDKAKQNNPIVGLIILTGFKFDGDDEWKNGDIYDPESDKIYSSYMYLKDNNTLKVRGYVGVSLFGRTETWARTN